MRRRKKHGHIYVILICAAAYVLLLVALVTAERGHPYSQINSFSDAVWYSLVTLSTVGYGDMMPETAAGRVIGVIFLLLAMGAFVALFGSVVSMLTSEGLPLLRLRFLRSRSWYYFAEFTSESDTLARDVLNEDPDAVIIYGISRERGTERPDYPCMFINATPSAIVKRKKDAGSRCKLFFLEENDIGSNMKALDVHRIPADVYARTTSGQEKMSGNIHFFHSYDCCARSYWRDNPLGSDENEIIIIGFGRYGMALLERAILMNINDSDFDVSYHIFGDWKRFSQIHSGLGEAFGINEKKPGCDSIFYHEEEWTEAHDLMGRADRIIICRDDEEAGWDDYWQLQRYYSNKGNVYLRSNRTAPGVRYFGTNEQIYTVNQIVRARLNDVARMMNDLYRSSVDESLDWEELDDHLRQSKIAAADHLLAKVRVLLGNTGISALDRDNCLEACAALRKARRDADSLDMLRRIEHSRWVRFYAYYNWSYGETRDEKKRENPMICSYDDLTEVQKAYHDRAWELLTEIARHIE